MKKKNYLEMAGILSLSLLLTSAFSISGCLPEMLREFNGYSRSNVEFLISVPSLAMIIMIALSPVISSKMNERAIVTAGLALTGIAGIMPCFLHYYPVILVTRILLGTGIGLINTRAVSLIGERFEGSQKARLMGIRGSMETLGQAALTFAAGQLLRLGWNNAFLIYGAAFVILIFYLVSVPTATSSGNQRKSEQIEPAYRLTGKDWARILRYVGLGGLMVSASCVSSLRIPSLIAGSGIGTASDGATVLSISVLSGFLGGFAFGKMVEKLKHMTLPVFLLSSATGLVITSFAGSMSLVILGAIISGFFITACISYGFTKIADSIPKEALNTANTAVLIGCNLGSTLTPFILQAIGQMNPHLSAGFFAYGVLLFVIAAFSLGNLKKA